MIKRARERPPAAKANGDKAHWTYAEQGKDRKEK